MKDGSDEEAIKKTTEALSSELQKIGEAIYKKVQQNTKKEEDPDPESSIRDAEFKEKDGGRDGESTSSDTSKK